MIATRNATGRRLHAAAPGAAGWLGLAAAPTFAAMALLTYMSGGGADMMCSAARDMPPLSGMVPMYVLMSAFHLAPWLRLGRSSLLDSRSTISGDRLGVREIHEFANADPAGAANLDDAEMS